MSAESNKVPYTGSCLCGSVQYAADKIEKQMAHCHCTMCRKFHGSAFSSFGEVKVENFHWLKGKEQLKGYLADNGTKRLFCSNCGSSLIFIPSNDTGEFIEFALGTLDSDIPYKPNSHIYTGNCAGWFQISDDLPKYKEGRDSKL